MAKMSAETEARMKVLARAIDHERQVKIDAKVEAAAIVAAKIKEATEKTDALIVDALRAKDRVAHIHKEGLKTKDSLRVRQIRDRLQFEPEPEETLESVKVKHYGWNEEPEVAWFETSTGMIERVQVPMDYQNEPLVAQTEEESALIAANRDLFVEALTKFYGK